MTNTSHKAWISTLCGFIFIQPPPPPKKNQNIEQTNFGDTTHARTVHFQNRLNESTS